VVAAARAQEEAEGVQVATQKATLMVGEVREAAVMVAAVMAAGPSEEGRAARTGFEGLMAAAVRVQEEVEGVQVATQKATLMVGGVREAAVMVAVVISAGSSVEAATLVVAGKIAAKRGGATSGPRSVELELLKTGRLE